MRPGDKSKRARRDFASRIARSELKGRYVTDRRIIGNGSGIRAWRAGGAA